MPITYRPCSHGNYINMCHRHELLKGFYNGFPDDIKAKILTSKHVTGLESSPSSVRVLCDDGTSYEGDMVIGADGVHSAVRRLMRPLSPKSPPGSSFLSSLLSSGARDGTKPFKSAYRILFGSVPRPEVTPAGSCYESHGTDASAQLFVGEERAWFFVYEKLDKPTRERTLYTQQDADSFAAAHAGLHLAPGLTLAAAYPRRQASGMTDLEEGVLRSWAAGRVVLLGDAVHKVTPNLGLGFNDGVIDLVALVNPLRRLVTGRRAARGGAVPEEALVALFRAYQAERTGLMSTVKDLSAMVTRMSTWATWLDWLLDRHVFPALGADVFLIRRFLGPKLATLPVLDWIEEEFFSQGKIPWKHIPRISQVVVA